jgi:hypothetical protein
MGPGSRWRCGWDRFEGLQCPGDRLIERHGSSFIPRTNERRVGWNRWNRHQSSLERAVRHGEPDPLRSAARGVPGLAGAQQALRPIGQSGGSPEGSQIHQSTGQVCAARLT